MNLLECLRSIEWVGGSFYGDDDCVRCPACESEHERREIGKAKHEPDCWLDQKIKQLEAEPVNTGSAMIAVVIETWKEIDHAIASVRATGAKEMADKLERLILEKHGGVIG